MLDLAQDILLGHEVRSRAARTVLGEPMLRAQRLDPGVLGPWLTQQHMPGRT